MLKNTKQVILYECHVKYTGKKVEVPAEWTRRIESSLSVYNLVKDRIRTEPVEVFYAIALDSRNRPIGFCEVARGGRSACALGPADVMRFLVLTGAVCTVFVHNHPSGDSTPSADDAAFTTRLIKAGKILGIKTIDHIIIGADDYFSFLDAGMMDVEGEFKGP